MRKAQWRKGRSTVFLDTKGNDNGNLGTLCAKELYWKTDRPALKAGDHSDERRDSMKGEIVRLVPRRGFGFIRTADGREVFFHATEVKDVSFESLHEGQEVEFEMGRDARSGRERATNVRVTQPVTV